MASLMPYVTEPFYAPLSTRFLTGSASRELRGRLDDFRGLRKALLDELCTRLHSLRGASITAREADLRAFADVQAERLMELEKVAERLREELVRQRLPGGSKPDWNAYREWKLGRGRLDQPREQIIKLELQVIRAAAYYQDGLSTAQRRLMREIAMELEEEAFRGDAPAVKMDSLFFVPDTVKIWLWFDVTPALAEGLAQFTQAKDAIKQELRDTVYKADGEMFRSGRVAPLAELARHQDPGIVALEVQAEAIRREILKVPRFDLPPIPPPLSEELVETIAAFVSERDSLREAEGAIALRQAEAAIPRRAHGGGPHPAHDQADLQARQVAAQSAYREARAQFRERNAGRIAAQEERLKRLKSLVRDAAGPEAAEGRGLYPDSFINEFITTRRLQEARSEYWNAVFQPGLSPEQRRLLFGGAMEKLDLPLPPADRQPTSIPGTVVP